MRSACTCSLPPSTPRSRTSLPHRIGRTEHLIETKKKERIGDEGTLSEVEIGTIPPLSRAWPYSSVLVSSNKPIEPSRAVPFHPKDSLFCYLALPLPLPGLGFSFWVFLPSRHLPSVSQSSLPFLPFLPLPPSLPQKTLTSLGVSSENSSKTLTEGAHRCSLTAINEKEKIKNHTQKRKKLCSPLPTCVRVRVRVLRPSDFAKTSPFVVGESPSLFTFAPVTSVLFFFPSLLSLYSVTVSSSFLVLVLFSSLSFRLPIALTDFSFPLCLALRVCSLLSPPLFLPLSSSSSHFFLKKKSFVSRVAERSPCHWVCSLLVFF